MLRELLRLVETAEGPISLTDLGRQLGVDAAVLDGMLQHWVRKGRLVVDGAGGQGCRGAGEKSSLASPLLSPAPPLPCSPASGCGSCSGMASCPFVARLPVTYRVNTIPLTAVSGPTTTD